MLLVISALKGYAIAAKDGHIGTVSDVLFDDTTWKMRWLVVDTGDWLPGRQVLIHPTALGQVDWKREVLPVHLTKKQVEDSPDVAQDLPVSRQMEDTLYNYYGWDRSWGSDSYIGMGAMGAPMAGAPYFGGSLAEERELAGIAMNAGDPHLRSADTVTGYDIHATDGDIGHVENLLMDSNSLTIRYLIVDTSNWWFGQHVLISPYAVSEIDWSAGKVGVNVTCAQVKASPAWDPLAEIDEAYERRLHTHYGWPGYGW